MSGEVVHFTEQGTTTLPVCWMKNGPLPEPRTTTDLEESTCADCKEIYAAIEEIHAAAADLGQSFSDIGKLLGENGN